MKKITIIMPFLNEEEEAVRTVESIYQTAPEEIFDIVAIDDCSENLSNLDKFGNIRYIRNKERIGVDGSRQLDIDMAQTPYVFVIDAHMRFKDDQWLQRVIECLEREPETAWCTTCVGLGYGTMDMNKHKGKYYGANMLFVDSEANAQRPAREVLEPKWAPKKDEVEYEIPCILGANYGFSKKWLEHINGLRGLKMWGSSEPFLSLKTWMAGGKCKIRTDIEIGHKFRSNAPYVTQVSSLVYNKIFLAKTILPQDLGDKLINHLPQDRNFRTAMAMINNNQDKIDEDRDYYSKIFKKTIYEYCEQFDINIP